MQRIFVIVEISQFKLLFSGDASSAVDASNRFSSASRSAASSASQLESATSGMAGVMDDAIGSVADLATACDQLSRSTSAGLARVGDFSDMYALEAETLTVGLRVLDDTILALDALSDRSVQMQELSKQRVLDIALETQLQSLLSSAYVDSTLSLRDYQTAVSGLLPGRPNVHVELPADKELKDGKAVLRGQAQQPFPSRSDRGNHETAAASMRAEVLRSQSAFQLLATAEENAARQCEELTKALTKAMTSWPPSAGSSQTTLGAKTATSHGAVDTASAVTDALSVENIEKALKEFAPKSNDIDAAPSGGNGTAARRRDRYAQLDSESGADPANRPDLDRSNVEKEFADKIATTIVTGLMDLTARTKIDPQLYQARVGYDQALSNLDTAYAGGLHNSDTASAFAHDRALIKGHLKQVEDAYKNNANTIGNTVKKIFADLAHTALEDVSKKLQKSLSESISKMLLSALKPSGHDPKDGGSQAGFSIGSTLGSSIGLPDRAPGSKMSTQVFNAQTLNVGSINGGFGGGGSSGSGLGFLMGAGLAAAFSGGHPGRSSTSGGSDLPPVRRAMGGDFLSGTPFIAGDPGPNSELVMPSTSGHVFTASETKAMMNKGSEGGHTTIENHFHIGDASPAAVTHFTKVSARQQIERAVRDGLRSASSKRQK